MRQGFREPVRVAALAGRILDTASRPWTLMEVCGGQTHAILRHGLQSLIAPAVELVHGPGCPVCVTPESMIDLAIALAMRPGVHVLSFGDMLRVPGSRGSLAAARAEGGGVGTIYSPLDALTIARDHPAREHVLFAVGFETTAPAFAAVVDSASRLGIDNLSVLCALVRVPPAMAAILDDGERRVDAFLAAGHVCVIEGTGDYEALAARFGVPIAITGFEPVDILHGVLACVERLEAGRGGVVNAYDRAVAPAGNPAARALVERIFEPCARPWRGLPALPGGALRLRAAYRELDAIERHGLAIAEDGRSTGCRSGEVLSGRIRPPECPEFGRGCRPEHPLGAPMVSSEGACAAYARYRPRS